MTAYNYRTVSACGECGYAIEWTPQRGKWIHVESELPDCYRDPQHTEQAYPKYAPAPAPLAPEEPASGTLTIELPAVLGFIAQCEICPQKALLSEQPAESWVCPRCAEVAEGNSSEPALYVDQIEGVQLEARTWVPGDPAPLPELPERSYPALGTVMRDVGPVLIEGTGIRLPQCFVPADPDDEYPISKVQG